MASNKQIKAGEAFLELAVRDGKFRKSLDQSIAKLRTLGATFKSIGSLGISGGGVAGLQRALALIAGSSALAWPVKLAADLEVAEAAFTALTGSSDKAKGILEGLQRFSGGSSFSFDQLQGAARNMLNFGVAAENVLPLVKQLGAIAAGDADRLDRLAIAFGQTQAKGRLMAEEVRQMVNAGFNPLAEMVVTTSRSMKQLLADMEAGNITAEQTAAAFASVTGAGGRFANILELIGNTATGQLNKLRAGIKVAATALGLDLLPSITDVLRYLNGLVPEFQRIVAANAGWAKVIAITVVGIGGLLAIMFSIGVTFQVAAFAAAGFVGALLSLVSPVAIIAANIVSLGVLFVKFTDLGASAFRFLGDKFGELGRVASETLQGIADALSGGNIVAATNVMWAGLKLAWMTGTFELRRIWQDYKFFFLQNTTGMLFKAQEIWAKFIAQLQGYFINLSRTVAEAMLDIGAWLNKIGASEGEQRAIDTINRIAKRQLGRESDDELAAIEARKQKTLDANAAIAQAAEEDRKRGLSNEVAALAKAQREAQAAFDKSREVAANSRFKGGKFKGKLDAALANFGLDGIGGAGSRGPASTFSGRLAPQIFGAAGSDVARQHLKEAKRANQHLEKIERKKPPQFWAGDG